MKLGIQLAPRCFAPRELLLPDFNHVHRRVTQELVLSFWSVYGGSGSQSAMHRDSASGGDRRRHGQRSSAGRPRATLTLPSRLLPRGRDAAPDRRSPLPAVRAPCCTAPLRLGSSRSGQAQAQVQVTGCSRLAGSSRSRQGGAVPRMETVVSGSNAKQLVQPPKSPMSDGCCSAASRLYGSISRGESHELQNFESRANSKRKRLLLPFGYTRLF